MIHTLIILLLAGPAPSALDDRCQMIEAAIGGKDPLPGIDSCALHAPCTERLVHVEPWFFVDGPGRTGLILRPDTVCKNTYLVVSRRRQLRKLAQGEMAEAVVIEFEKLSNSHYQFHAFIEAIDGKDGSGSPGCGGEDHGTIIKRRGKWEKRIYEIPARADPNTTGATNDSSKKPSSVHGTTDTPSNSRDTR